MASNAGSWFYETPEGSPYLLQERVNSNLWMARLWDLYFVTVQAEAPFKMSAQWQDQPVSIEWQPNAWLRLTAEHDVSLVAIAFSNILQIPATLTYTTLDGKNITEWHRDGGEARWREIQGNPTFQSPALLSS